LIVVKDRAECASILRELGNIKSGQLRRLKS
jgi:hypothetical protein